MAERGRDFTSWLEENIDHFNEQVGINVTITGHERRVGDFFVDLVGEDGNSLVVIENQLEKTEHEHFGKILTYLAVMGAKTAIWITSEPREEHAKAVEWLNEVTPADYAFYLIKVKAIQIDESPAAPLFSIEVGPSQVVKEAGEERRELAKRHYERREFWTTFLERAKSKTDLFNNISPTFDNWINVGAGRSGVMFTIAILMNEASCGITLDRGKGFEKLNKSRFDELFSKKDEIEAKLGRKLEWLRLDDRQVSRIRVTFSGVGLRDKEEWPELQEKMIDTTVKIREVFTPYIKALKE
jgi:hypothetical protein